MARSQPVYPDSRKQIISQGLKPTTEPQPNAEELENDPILKGKADHHVSWKDFQDEDMDKVNNTVNQILQSIS